MTTDYTQNVQTQTQTGNQRQAERFDFFSGTQYNTQPDVGAKLVYGRRQVRGRQDLFLWWVEIRDPRGGLNATQGDFDWAYDRAKSSTLDTRFVRTLCLPQLTTNATSPDPTGNLKGFHQAEFGGVQFFALGSGNDVALYKETSATDPTPAAITGAGTAGRPGASITCLVPVVLGGGTAAQQLLIGRDSGVPLLMTDTAGTLNVTAMHADLNPTWGAFQTPQQPGRTILLLANGRVRTLADSDAVSAEADVPESTATYPNGGYIKGMLRLDNGPQRVYMGIPYENTTGGVLLFGTEKLHRLVSINNEGSDSQDVTTTLEGGILQFELIESKQAIVAHNGERMIVNRGGVEPVPVFVDRSPNSDREYRLRNMVVNGNEVIYEVNHRATSAGTGNTTRHWESYDLNTGAVHQISADQTLSGTGVFGVLNASSGLLSRFTRFTQIYSDGAWRRIKIPRYGENPFFLARQTSGSQSGTGDEYEASGTWTSPDWELPDLEGMAKVVTKITMLGDVHAAGTAATAGNVAVTAGGMSHTFVTGYDGKAQVARFVGNKHTFYKLGVSVTATRTTASTRFTPNCFPIRIEGYAFRDVDADLDLIPEMDIEGAAR